MMGNEALVLADMLGIGAAVLAGSLIGLERELRDKAAGFRTMVFICTGAALFTILSHNLAKDGETSRMAGTIVTGVGFLGAGAILRDGVRIAGLNTAATIWLTAAIGMTMGSGQFFFGTLVTAATLVILWLFPVIEQVVDRLIDENSYDLVFAADSAILKRLDDLFSSDGLTVLYVRRNKRGRDLHARWTVRASRKSHDRLVAQLLADVDIRELSY
jgi:putative Mg2+ transporter-C (MgtC) family protein